MTVLPMLVDRTRGEDVESWPLLEKDCNEGVEPFCAELLIRDRCR